MTDNKIEAAAALALLERVVAERGAEYIYEPQDFEGQCTYVHGLTDGGLEVGCGVGLAATYIGLPLSELRTWDFANATSVRYVAVDYFTSGALAVLAEFQHAQDSHVSYGDALECARRVLAEPSGK